MQRKGEEKGGEDVRVQVKLSCDETTVQAVHASTHCPFERKEPGMHAVHCSLLAVDTWSELGIRQAEHFAGHARQRKQLKCRPINTVALLADKKGDTNHRTISC